MSERLRVVPGPGLGGVQRQHEGGLLTT